MPSSRPSLSWMAKYIDMRYHFLRGKKIIQVMKACTVDDHASMLIKIVHMSSSDRHYLDLLNILTCWWPLGVSWVYLAIFVYIEFYLWRIQVKVEICWNTWIFCLTLQMTKHRAFFSILNLFWPIPLILLKRYHINHPSFLFCHYLYSVHSPSQG